nr:MAG TPA: ChiA1-BD-binding domain protein [Caudoviricetes sp.]
MSYLENAQKLRAEIDSAAALLTDEQAATVPGIYPAWNGDGAAYAVGDRVQYSGALYKCLQAHTSQATWTPTDAPSLWAKVLIPTPGEIPDWEQPSSTNPYAKGDKVKHNGKIWTSDIDGNVWEPGVYGWTEVTE